MATGYALEEFEKPKGFKLLYDLAVHLTSLREQFSGEEENSLAQFTALDWENINRIITTYLFGTFTRWSLEGLATRNSLFFLDHLQDKIDCILNKGGVEGCREEVQYQLLLMHDLNILSLLKQFGL